MVLAGLFRYHSAFCISPGQNMFPASSSVKFSIVSRLLISILIATTFMPYDDEGYVLLSLANFSEHGGLYDQVFTQYGPFPFLYYDLLHWLSGWPIAHTLGRAVTLLHWVGSALGAGLIAWRLSGRYWTAWFTTGITFGYLWQMTSEPAHPGSLIALITAIGLAGAVEALLRQKPTLAMAVLGLTGAVLALTKINVGLLWCATAGAFALLMTGAKSFAMTCKAT